MREMRLRSKFTLHDMQDISLYGFSWAPRLRGNCQLHACSIGLLCASSASPSSVGIFVRQSYNVVPSPCMTLGPSSTNVGLRDMQVSSVPMYDVPGHKVRNTPIRYNAFLVRERSWGGGGGGLGELFCFNKPQGKQCYSIHFLGKNHVKKGIFHQFREIELNYYIVQASIEECHFYKYQ